MLENLIRNHGSSALFLFFLLGVIPTWQYDSEYYAAYIFFMKFLFFPLLILGAYIFWFKMPNIKEKTGPVKGGLFILGLVLTVMLFCEGHLLLLNSVIGQQKTVIVEGKVVDKEVFLEPVKHYITIKDRKTRKTRKLEVDEHTYSSYIIGWHYSGRWQKGFLGLIYKTN